MKKEFMKRAFLLLFLSVPGITFAQNLSFSGGNAHSVMLCNDGSVYTMGRNNSGQLGTDGSPTQSLVPIKVLRGTQPAILNDGTHLGSIKQVDAGSGAHSVALDCNGQVWSWGWNSFGQLGDNTQTNRNTPIQVVTGNQNHPSGFLSDVIFVSAGNENSYVILRNGMVMAWGKNDRGQLGDGTTANKFFPVYVKTSATDTLKNVIHIDGGDDFGLALRSDGTVWTWGYNNNRQLGQNNNTNHLYATQVFRNAARTIPLTNIIKVTGGDTHSMALAADGTLWSWGGNWSGQLGFNTGGADAGLPGQVVMSNGGPLLTNVIAISAGNRHSMAVRSDGTLFTWGGTGANNYFGQTGTGGGTAYPTAVSSLSNIVDVSDGDLWTFAVNSSGTVYAFGQNGVTSGPGAGQWLGSLGVNSTNATEPTPLAISLPCGILKPCVEAFLGPDVILCNPPSHTLNAPAGDATVQYRWLKDGVPLANTSSSLFVNQGGTYTLVMWDSSYTNGCGYCPPDSDHVVVTNASPVTANNATFCPPSCTPTLSVIGSAGNDYDWYLSQFGGTAQNGAPTSSFQTPCLSTTTTYWVQDRTTVRCTAGYPPGSPLTGSSSQWYTNNENKLNFDVLSPFYLDSVTIVFDRINHGPCAGVPSAQVFNIIITPPSGFGSASTYTPVVPCGSGFVTVTVPIGHYFSAVANGYRIEFGGGTGVDVRFFTGGAVYPKTDCGLIRYTNSVGVASTNPRWGGFYNWQLRTGTNTCGRTPVVAQLNCIMPVDFSYFNAQAREGKVNLNWITSSEINNSHFSVQRSSDGINFENIGTVPGAGNSSVSTNYLFTDEDPLPGISYYRIQQHDFDGKSSLSEIRAVSFTGAGISLFPNPFSYGINLIASYQKKITFDVVITDLAGRTVFSGTFMTNEKISLGEDLAPGMYIIKTFIEKDIQVFKINKTK